MPTSTHSSPYPEAPPRCWCDPCPGHHPALLLCDCWPVCHPDGCCFIPVGRRRLCTRSEPSGGGGRHNGECGIIGERGRAVVALRLPSVQGRLCASLHAEGLSLCSCLRTHAGVRHVFLPSAPHAFSRPVKASEPPVGPTDRSEVLARLRQRVMLQVTAFTSTALTVTRGAGGTSPLDHPMGRCTCYSHDAACEAKATAADCTGVSGCAMSDAFRIEKSRSCANVMLLGCVPFWVFVFTARREAHGMLRRCVWWTRKCCRL